jgi:hypothetical protein
MIKQIKTKSMKRKTISARIKALFTWLNPCEKHIHNNKAIVVSISLKPY